ncbi:asparagine synthase [Candidatus Woesearchaeota archaeon]|nr:asparagine synthase [Candidatus Woesearchaeota archaeon]
MSEPYLKDGKLIPKDEWLAFLEPFGQVQILSEGNREHILQELQNKLEQAVKKRIPKEGKIGVLFSGGIDSVIIAFLLKRLGVTFTCLTIGFQDGNAKPPEDLVESERIAKELGFRQESIIFNMENIEPLFRKTAKILGNLTNVVNIGVGSVEVAGIEKGKELGITHFFGGLGAEEIFAGYDRHEQALKQGNDALHAECLDGMRSSLYERDFQRDVTIAQHFSITLHTPFLDEELIEFALAIPPKLKINPEKTFHGKKRGDLPEERTQRKVILREAAEAIGIPEDIAWRPKRAAQYGSRTNNALTKLRKRGGYRDKEEYLGSLLS